MLSGATISSFWEIFFCIACFLLQVGFSRRLGFSFSVFYFLRVSPVPFSFRLNVFIGVVVGLGWWLRRCRWLGRHVVRLGSRTVAK